MTGAGLMGLPGNTLSGLILIMSVLCSQYHVLLILFLNLGKQYQRRSLHYSAEQLAALRLERSQEWKLWICL